MNHELDSNFRLRGTRLNLVESVECKNNKIYVNNDLFFEIFFIPKASKGAL